MDGKQDVKLYIYDVSNGLARSLSPVLLGRQISGVWHTAVVVYGEEFFYGGIGIQSCSPGGTILGAPTEVVSLGQSELPYDVFLSYLEELSQNAFRGDCYHLFNHNCNTFSNELANFLTGRNIPEHITNLPQEVLQTPFGTMIKPFVDAMSVSPQGGHALFDSSATDAEPSLKAGDDQHRASNSATEPSSNANPGSYTSSIKAPRVITYCDDTVLDNFSSQRSSLAAALSPLDMQLVDEVNEYLTLKGIRDWSLSMAHLKALCRVISDMEIAVGVRQLLALFLQMALLSDDLISACIHDPDASFANLTRDHNQFSDELLIAVAKCVCNCVSTRPGAEWFIKLPPHDSSSGSSLIAVLCNSWLLSTNVSIRSVACHIVCSVTSNVQSLSADLAMDLGIPLIEACKQPLTQSVEYLWYALCVCITANSQLAELLMAMDLDISEQEKTFPAISDYTRQIRRVISATHS